MCKILVITSVKMEKKGNLGAFTCLKTHKEWQNVRIKLIRTLEDFEQFTATKRLLN